MIKLMACFILTASLSLTAACRQADVAFPYSEGDQFFVDRALAFYSGYGKEPIEKIKQEVYPVVVHLPGRACVGLNARQGYAGIYHAGGTYTVCYDDKTGKGIGYYVYGN